MDGAKALFWRLSPERRAELVWERLKRAFNAYLLKVSDHGLSADLYSFAARFSYSVVTRGWTNVIKTFKYSTFYSNPPKPIPGHDRFTVVDLTVVPAFLPEVTIHVVYPPLLVRGRGHCVTMTALAMDGSVAAVTEAALSPFRVAQLLRSPESLVRVSDGAYKTA